MKQKIRIASLVFLLGFYSCGQKQEMMSIAGDAKALEQPANSKETAPNEAVPMDRKIIKEGSITFETSDAKKTSAVIIKSVSDFKGYISKDNVYDLQDRIEHTVTIRVPADKFEFLLTKISEDAKKLDSKNIEALDVTEEFVDVEARIKTKKELEARYKDLLKQAHKVDEILSIEKEIGNLRTEIESIEGRLKYLKDKVSYSTLTVVFYEKTNSSFGFTGQMGQALHNGWSNLLWFFVAVTNVWPFVLIAILAFVGLRKLRNRNKKKI